jgi:TPR repeat protein
MEKWFAAIGGRREGPMDLDALVAKLLDGSTPETTPVWKVGMDRWTPAGSIPEVSARLPPALPAHVPPLRTTHAISPTQPASDQTEGRPEIQSGVERVVATGSAAADHRARPAARDVPNARRSQVAVVKPFRPWIRGIRNSTENGIVSVALALSLVLIIAFSKARGPALIFEAILGTALSGALCGALCIGIYRLFGGGRKTWTRRAGPARWQPAASVEGPASQIPPAIPEEEREVVWYKATSKSLNRPATVALWLGLVSMFCFPIGVIPLLGIALGVYALIRAAALNGVGRTRALIALALSLVYTAMFLGFWGWLGRSFQNVCDPPAARSCRERWPGSDVVHRVHARMACEAGNAIGCNDLGVLYDTGNGVEHDKVKAAALYRAACDGGDAPGCNSLGRMYFYGEGVAKDKMMAAQLYQKACDGGVAGGCLGLGSMFDKGDGIAQDQAKAVRCYRMACDGSDARGCSHLGTAYENGAGVVQDAAKAIELYRKACDGGYAGGCSDLGMMYQFGKGVAQDRAKAAELYRKACNGGDIVACGFLDFMSRETQ